MNMPGGILNDSYGLCFLCRMQARLNSLAFHYSMGLSFTVAFKLWETKINESPGISKER